MRGYDCLLQKEIFIKNFFFFFMKFILNEKKNVLMVHFYWVNTEQLKKIYIELVLNLTIAKIERMQSNFSKLQFILYLEKGLLIAHFYRV